MHRESSDYVAPKKVCAACELRERYTRNKAGRTAKRHLRQDELNTMRQNSQSAGAKKDIKTRQHLMERSFANATRLAFTGVTGWLFKERDVVSFFLSPKKYSTVSIGFGQQTVKT
jgi:hypothetical protein